MAGQRPAPRLAGVSRPLVLPHGPAPPAHRLPIHAFFAIPRCPFRRWSEKIHRRIQGLHALRTMDSRYGTCRPLLCSPGPAFRPRCFCQIAVRHPAGPALDRIPARQSPALTRTRTRLWPRPTKHRTKRPDRTPRSTSRRRQISEPARRSAQGGAFCLRGAPHAAAPARLASRNQLVYRQPVAIWATESTNKKRRVWPLTLHGSVPAEGEAT